MDDRPKSTARVAATAIVLRLGVTALRGALVFIVARNTDTDFAGDYFSIARIVALTSIACGMEMFQVVTRRMVDSPVDAGAWLRWQLRTTMIRSVVAAVLLGLATKFGWLTNTSALAVGVLVFTDGLASDVGRWLLTTGRVSTSNAYMLVRTAAWTIPVGAWLTIAPESLTIVEVLWSWSAANLLVTAAWAWCYRCDLATQHSPSKSERTQAFKEGRALFSATAAVLVIEAFPILVAQPLDSRDLAAIGLYLSLGSLVQTVVSTAVWQPAMRALACATNGTSAARQITQRIMLWGAAAVLGSVVAAGVIAYASSSDAYARNWLSGSTIMGAQILWIIGLSGQARLYSARRDFTSSAIAWTGAAIGLVVMVLLGRTTPERICIAYLIAHIALACGRWLVVTRIERNSSNVTETRMGGAA